MKVKCVDNGNGLLNLTVGKEYKVLVKTEQSYLVMNDDGLEQLYNKERFETVKDEQQIKLQCDSCIHQQVCGHKTEWKNYCKEHIELRKKSVLFDVEPNCRYYINKDVLEKKEINEVKTDNKKKDWTDILNPPRVYTTVPTTDVFDKDLWRYDDKKKAKMESNNKYKDKELNHIVEDTREKELKTLTEEEFVKVLEKLFSLK